MRSFSMTLVLVLSEVGPLFAIELPNVNKVPSKITQQFPGYGLIFHYDNTTRLELDTFFGGGAPVIILINYDMSQDLRRPDGYQFVNIVYLTDPFLFEEFSNGKFNLEHTDVVIFVTSGFSVLNSTRPRFDVTYIWNQKGLDQCGCVVLYDIAANDFCYVHFYVGRMTGVLNKIQIKRGVPRLLDYMNEFRDFNEHQFKVAFYPYAPFIYCGEHYDVMNYSCMVEGIDGEVLKLLSRYLNFRFHMKNSAHLRSGGEWKAMIEDVHFKRMDWAVGGISRTLERMQLADFTTMLHIESYTGLYVTTRANMLNEWNNILLPFHVLVWLGLLAIIVCLGWLIKAIISTIRRKPNNVIDYLRIPLHAVVDQSIPGLRHYVGGIKILLSGWFLVAIIITTAYKSKLASSMIQPHSSDPNSIQELYDDGYLFQVNKEDWTVLRESLQAAPDSRYQKVMEKSNADLDFCAAVVHTFDGKIAIIDEETPMQYIVTIQCRQYLSISRLSRFRMVKQRLFPSIHGWPLQLGAPYRNRFSKIFQRLLSGGILDYWYKTITTRPVPKSNSHVIDVGTATSLTISSFLGPSFVLVVGMGLAFVVFLLELVRFKYRS